MNLMKLVGVTIVTLAAAGWLIAGQEDIQKMPIEMLINDLSSGQGAKRIVASASLPPRQGDSTRSQKAGAKQVAPVGGTVDGTRRLDMVYSALEGFPLNQPKARAGYRTDNFGLHVEKGTTAEDIQKICQKYECTPIGKFSTESRPSCYLKIGPGPRWKR